MDNCWVYTDSYWKVLPKKTNNQGFCGIFHCQNSTLKAKFIGIYYARHFSWTSAANQTINVYCKRRLSIMDFGIRYSTGLQAFGRRRRPPLHHFEYYCQVYLASDQSLFLEANSRSHWNLLPVEVATEKSMSDMCIWVEVNLMKRVSVGVETQHLKADKICNTSPFSMFCKVCRNQRHDVEQCKAE